MALLHNRIRIDKLGTSATSVSLTAESDGGSYFDEYLDLIVNFFDAESIDVVIFEDLDRFEDPQIYEALRELNTLLNGLATKLLTTINGSSQSLCTCFTTVTRASRAPAAGRTNV